MPSKDPGDAAGVAPPTAAQPASPDAELLAHARAWAVAHHGSPPLTITLDLQDGSRHILTDLPARRHTADYRSVVWDGVAYFFTENQAAVVKLLWDAQPLGGDVGKRALMSAARTSADEALRDVFKAGGGKINAAWGTLIIEGRSRGSYRLAP